MSTKLSTKFLDDLAECGGVDGRVIRSPPPPAPHARWPKKYRHSLAGTTFRLKKASKSLSRAGNSLGCTHQQSILEKFNRASSVAVIYFTPCRKCLIYIGIRRLHFWQATYQKHGFSRAGGLCTGDINKVIHRFSGLLEKLLMDQSLACDIVEIAGHHASAASTKSPLNVLLTN